MSDVEVLEYLQSHAPLERFYLFKSPEGDILMKYFDRSGRSWNLMEDDDAFSSRAISFLRRSGVRVFDDFSALLRYEREAAHL
ncbi:MAG TPA: hypothetical protein VMA55_14410 [Acidovorax sp.]|nr:hypothetical protein [Acidovorax sp.]